MRQLTPAPSLDHLKQQAKDLLVALRETHPDAKLSDAQRTLARQYGFRTWPELKAEVERRRQVPEIFDTETAASIAKAFELGELTRAARVIGRDVGGPQVQLFTTRGVWCAHAVLPGFDDEHGDEVVRLMDAARAAGVPVPAVVRSASGGLTEVAGEHQWRVDEWLDRGPTIPSPVSSEMAFKAGALLATLHQLNLEPARGIHPWLSAGRRTADHWEAIIAKVEEATVPWGDTLAEAVPSILEISAVATDPPPDRLVLSHTDFQPSSTHVGKDQSLMPDGWEFAGAIPPGWHIGLVLDSWCAMPDDQLNTNAARALMDGYASVTGTRPDLDLSIFRPVVTAWLNWLMSRIVHALEAQSRDDAHATRELFHMLRFPKDRARFERLLEAAQR